MRDETQRVHRDLGRKLLEVEPDGLRRVLMRTPLTGDEAAALALARRARNLEYELESTCRLAAV